MARGRRRPWGGPAQPLWLGVRGQARETVASADRPQVYRMPYYEACVRDACGCDSGGDCECLCDAVAAYAQACLDKGVCVDWRAPDFCRECGADRRGGSPRGHLGVPVP